MTVTAVHEQDEDPMNLLTSTTRSGRSYEPNTSTPMVAGGFSSASGDHNSGHAHLRPDGMTQHAQTAAESSAGEPTHIGGGGQQERHLPGSDSTPTSTASALYKNLGVSGQEFLGRVASSLRAGSKPKEHPGEEQQGSSIRPEDQSDRDMLMSRIAELENELIRRPPVQDDPQGQHQWMRALKSRAEMGHLGMACPPASGAAPGRLGKALRGVSFPSEANDESSDESDGDSAVSAASERAVAYEANDVVRALDRALKSRQKGTAPARELHANQVEQHKIPLESPAQLAEWTTRFWSVAAGMCPKAGELIEALHSSHAEASALERSSSAYGTASKWLARQLMACTPTQSEAGKRLRKDFSASMAVCSSGVAMWQLIMARKDTRDPVRADEAEAKYQSRRSSYFGNPQASFDEFRNAAADFRADYLARPEDRRSDSEYAIMSTMLDLLPACLRTQGNPVARRERARLDKRRVAGRAMPAWDAFVADLAIELKHASPIELAEANLLDAGKGKGGPSGCGYASSGRGGGAGRGGAWHSAGKGPGKGGGKGKGGRGSAGGGRGSAAFAGCHKCGSSAHWAADCSSKCANCWTQNCRGNWMGAHKCVFLTSEMPPREECTQPDGEPMPPQRYDRLAEKHAVWWEAEANVLEGESDGDVQAMEASLAEVSVSGIDGPSEPEW
jgi:hypothetical protein